jgi:hypothetical protein
MIYRRSRRWLVHLQLAVPRATGMWEVEPSGNDVDQEC